MLQGTFFEISPSLIATIYFLSHLSFHTFTVSHLATFHFLPSSFCFNPSTSLPFPHTVHFTITSFLSFLPFHTCFPRSLSLPFHPSSSIPISFPPFPFPISHIPFATSFPFHSTWVTSLHPPRLTHSLPPSSLPLPSLPSLTLPRYIPLLIG